MHKLLISLGSITVTALSLSCQPKTKTKIVEVPKKDKVYSFQKETEGTPIPVPVYDSACNGQRGLSLRSSIIGEAYMAVETKQTETVIMEDVFENAMTKNVLRRTTEWETISAGRPVYLCRDAEKVPANTQEGAAIRMKAAADQAYSLYESVRLRQQLPLPALTKVDLHAAVKEQSISRIVPRDEEPTELTSYFTDNAVYMPGSTPTLISYPQSVLGKEYNIFGGTPLWAIDGIFQHEFGHFIFDSVMNSDGIRFASYHDYVEKNPRLHTIHTPAATFQQLGQQPDRRAQFLNFVQSQSFFVASLNEGFSDLWAYYTMKQPAAMWDFNCFAQSRNVASPLFYKGLSKNWDETLWNKIFNSGENLVQNKKYDDPIEACSDPYFADVHIVGAAMAHAADAIFTAAALTHSENVDRSLLKAEMALSWLKAIKDSNEFEDQGGKASLSRILNTAVGTGMSYLKSTDREAFCAVVASKVPVLMSRWKAVKTDNEDVAGVVSFCAAP